MSHRMGSLPVVEAVFVKFDFIFKLRTHQNISAVQHFLLFNVLLTQSSAWSSCRREATSMDDIATKVRPFERLLTDSSQQFMLLHSCIVPVL